jgi:NADH-quinone oxidoreductase subunit A
VSDLLLILLFVVAAGGFVFGSLLVGRFVRPAVRDREKLTTYECGERPFHRAWFNYNPRFYVIALIFIVFDVAVVLMIPPLIRLRQTLDKGAFLVPFLGITAYLVLLAVPLAYVWIKGDLEWVTKAPKQP